LLKERNVLKCLQGEKMSSWAEEYERMKRERLAQEAANKNKNVGFAQPLLKVNPHFFWP
jgi:hypothetical protein